LKIGGGGLIGIAEDGFEGSEVDDEVFLVDEKSCER
jgi:hypothetical protein